MYMYMYMYMYIYIYIYIYVYVYFSFQIAVLNSKHYFESTLNVGGTIEGIILRNDQR